MRAMVINQIGLCSEFESIELPIPKIKQGEVLIKVHATSVNPLDYKLRQGIMPNLVPSFPMILHGDVAGIIEDVASDVTQFKKGDEIYGCIGGLLNMQGAAADYTVADCNLISKKPKNLTMSQAAALPLVAEACFEALVNKLKIKHGQSILIHGGTGGVGHFAIQLAKYYDAKVFTTVSNPQKYDLALNFGADVAINYKQQTVQEYVDQYTAGKGFDCVFDTVGGENLTTSLQAVKACGNVVTIAPHGAYDLTELFLKNASLHCVMQPLPLITGAGRARYSKMLSDTTRLIEDVKLTPLIDPKVFQMQDIGQAHQYLESGQAVGKVVINNN